MTKKIKNTMELIAAVENLQPASVLLLTNRFLQDNRLRYT